MNDIAKKSAAERLIKAMELEKLGPSDTGRKLGILPQYVTMSKQEKYWPKMPKSAWDRILHWVNTGETLHHYKPPIELAPKEIARKPIENSRVATEEETKKIIDSMKLPAPLAVEKLTPAPDVQFTDTARLKVALDIEINLVVNGQKIQIN
ncbi:MAG: hypothetical protein ABFC18_03355 [Rikenellaceae bacterium]